MYLSIIGKAFDTTNNGEIFHLNSICVHFVRARESSLIDFHLELDLTKTLNISFNITGVRFQLGREDANWCRL